MSDGSDFIKSLVKRAADRAGERVSRFGPIARVRRFARDASRRRTAIDDRMLSSAVARIHGVSAASVAIRSGVIRVDASFDGGDHVAIGLIPEGAAFAPRGAKELRFRVVPPEAARQLHASDVAGAVAGEVARVLWALFLRDEENLGGAIVDRDGDLFRVDLRTIPAVKNQSTTGPFSLMLDALELGAIDVSEGMLEVQLRMPSLGR